MSLIKCEECFKEISDKATTCPHCGAPTDKASQNIVNPNVCSNCGTNYIVEKKPVTLSPVMIVSIPLFLIGVFTLLSNWIVALIIIGIAFMIDHFGRSKKTVLVCPKCKY